MGGDGYDQPSVGEKSQDDEEAVTALLGQITNLSHQPGTDAYKPAYGTTGAPASGYSAGSYAQATYPRSYALGAMQPLATETQFRTWHAHYCCLLGECTNTDLGSCLLSCCCPCFAFGQNMARVLNLSWRIECLKFLGFMLVFLGINAIWSLACPMGWGEIDEVVGWDDYGQPVIQTYWGPISRECNPLYSSVISFATLCVMVLMAIWAGGRRTAIREQFGIPGSKACDAVGWLFCQACSLSQETRTLAHNNVVDGVWHGPLVAAPVPGSLPGVPSCMTVWDRIAPVPFSRR